MGSKLFNIAKQLYMEKYPVNSLDFTSTNANLSIEQENEYDDSLESNTAEISVVGDNKSPKIEIHNEISKNTLDGEDDKSERGNTYSLLSKSKNVSKIPDSTLLSTKTNWEPINLKDIEESYHLYGLAHCEIYFDEEKDSVRYVIIEPKLGDDEKHILKELKRGFVYVFEKYSPKFVNEKDEELINKGMDMLIKKYRFKVNEENRKKLAYYLKRDFLGLEVIEPLLHDPFIEDISCDGLNVPFFVNHLKYGALEVNRQYEDNDLLDSFIVKLAQKSNQEISLAKPILQGALPDGSRVEAIYGEEISEKGSSFTIRKFREEPFTPVHLLKLATMPSLLLAYLWIAVENKQSILVSGGTASGKTTILNALSLFVPPSNKIVSIEDTPEINLPHEHWLPMITREREGKSQITMFDLLKASLRERPDFIIVGEIRGKEANILFQGMASGHAGLGTVHAQKFDDLVNRMTIDPINLPKPLLTEIDIILFQKAVKIGNNMVRRTSSVVEVVKYAQANDDFIINEFMKFKQSKDEFEFAEQSSILSDLLEKKGGSEENLWSEIERRKRILDTLVKENIFEFTEVNKVIKYYYKNPTQIFNYISEVKETLKIEEEEE